MARGLILAARPRLGHADSAATLLREYAHALPLNDGAVADVRDRQLHPVDNQVPAESEPDAQ